MRQSVLLPLLLAALTALLLLCLVRSVTERGDGRLWAGVLTGSALPCAKRMERSMF